MILLRRNVYTYVLSRASLMEGDETPNVFIPNPFVLLSSWCVELVSLYVFRIYTSFHWMHLCKTRILVYVGKSVWACASVSASASVSVGVV